MKEDAEKWLEREVSELASMCFLSVFLLLSLHILREGSEIRLEKFVGTNGCCVPPNADDLQCLSITNSLKVAITTVFTALICAQMAVSGVPVCFVSGFLANFLVD